jgi:hypothetical protein
MTHEQITKLIKEIRGRATEMGKQDYPVTEDGLKKWRTTVDNIRGDINRLEFLWKALPNRVTVEPLPFQEGRECMTTGSGDFRPAG